MFINYSTETMKTTKKNETFIVQNCLVPNIWQNIKPLQKGFIAFFTASYALQTKYKFNLLHIAPKIS